MKRVLALLFVLTMLGLGYAQDVPDTAGPDLGIPAEVKPTGQYVVLQPKTEAKAITYIGRSGVDPLPSGLLADQRWFLLDARGLAAGRYDFTAVGSKNDVHSRVDFVVVIGEPGPGPGPQPPPGPGPGPGPAPGPSPTVGADGFHTLIVEETEDRPKLPQAQLFAMIGKELPDYLNSHCAKIGNRPDWFIQDDDLGQIEIAALPPHWQKPYQDAVTYAHNIPKLANGAQPPVIVLSNSKIPTGPKGTLTTLPATKDGIMALVKKFGDAQ